jgi:hypothetical protein
MSDAAARQRARLAYEASLRALDHQRQALDEIRSRTGVVLAAASLSASFLGARAFDEHHFAILSFLALAALVMTLVVGTLVLAPRGEFLFSVSGTVLYQDLAEVEDEAEQLRYVAHWLDQFWECNRSPIRKLARRFEIAAGALVVQILLWTLATSGTLD